MERLAGKVALVTGAGRGMGREIASRLAVEGANLVAHYSGSRAGAEDLVERISRDGGAAFAHRADISKRAEVAALFAEIDGAFGRLDIVVNNAGVSGEGGLVALDDAQLDAILGVNMRGALYVASEAAKRLGQGGRIINIGSSLGDFPMDGAGVYSASKAAIKAFTESWAKELGRKGVTVNTVVAGAASPGMMENALPLYRSFFERASPFGRIGTAEEIAAVVAFLASPEASWVSGAHIRANGAANT